MSLHKLIPSADVADLASNEEEQMKFLTAEILNLAVFPPLNEKLAQAVENIYYSIGRPMPEVDFCRNTCEDLIVGIHLRIQTVITIEGDHIPISALAPRDLYEDVVSMRIDTFYCPKHKQMSQKRGMRISVNDFFRYMQMIPRKPGEEINFKK